MRGAQKTLAHLVGGCFLHAAEFDELCLCGLLAHHDRAHARIARTRHHRGNAHHHADQHGNGRLGNRRGVANEMAARHVAGFVRQHADHLIGRFQFHDEAGVDEDVLAFGDERVDRRIVDDINFHRRRIEARRLQDRIFVTAQHALDFGVADERDRLRRRGRDARREEGEERREKQNRAQETVAQRQGVNAPLCARSARTDGMCARPFASTDAAARCLTGPRNGAFRSPVSYQMFIEKRALLVSRG